MKRYGEVKECINLVFSAQPLQKRLSGVTEMEKKEVRCPFLKEERVAFCRAFPVRKMLPFDKIYAKESLCFKESHTNCPIFKEAVSNRSGKERMEAKTRSSICPFLEVEHVIYCEVYPVKKMIPASSYKLECPCNTEKYVECSVYQRMVQGDLYEQGKTITTVYGFLIEDTLYYCSGHTWFKWLDDDVKIGLDDFGQSLIGTIDKVIMPKPGDEVDAYEPFIKLISKGESIELLSPLSGTVVEVNRYVCENTSLMNLDPYGDGWLIRLKPKKEVRGDEIDNLKLIKGEEARKWLEKEVDKLHQILQTEVGITMADGGDLIRNIHEVLGEKWSILIRNFFRKEG